MREIVYSVSGTKDKIKNAIGLNVKLKVNRGRNKIEMIEGITSIESNILSLFSSIKIIKIHGTSNLVMLLELNLIQQQVKLPTLTNIKRDCISKITISHGIYSNN